MHPWETLIDDAARLCGSQNELARRIGATGPNLAQAKAGRRPINRQQLESLADILGLDPAELWRAQELANMERRNPFRRSVAASMAALIAVILSGLAPADSRAATTTYGHINAGTALHIVAS